MPKISVVIPVYNVEKYLRECLDSVCAQTMTDIEIICVDDGSTDSSPSILDAYAAKDKRFNVIKREHSNAGACRNAGLDIANGEYLSFLDSDDVFSPKMLETLHYAIKANDAEIATCGIVKFRDGTNAPKLDREASSDLSQVYTCPAASLDIFTIWEGRAWDKLFRKHFIDKEGLRFQEIRSANDARFTYSALSLAAKVVYVPVKMIAYRVSSGSLERTRHLSATCVGEAITSYAYEMNRRGVFVHYPSLKRSFKRWATRTLFWNMDTIGTADGYVAAHSTFSGICAELNLRSVAVQLQAEGNPMGLRLSRICDGCSPIDSLLLSRNMLRDEMTSLRPLKGIECSNSYRIGLIVTWLPRTIKHFLRHIMCHVKS